MKPPNDQKRRQVSSPSLRRDKPALDEQPERLSVNHPGVEDANQPPPARRGTLPGGMAAIPVRTSGEYQPTLPAPNPLQRQTVQRPAPPSAVALARRTDPPPPAETPVPESLSGGQSDAPTSQRAEDREKVLERELAKERARRLEVERQARVKAESQGPGPYQAPIVVPERPSRAPESAAGDGSAKALRSALTKLSLGIAALLAILGIPLTAYIQAMATKIERSNAQAAQANARADAVDDKAGTNAKGQTELDKQFRQYRANRRELDRLQGIEYPKVDGDPEPENLKPVTPLCAPGKVCPGPQIILLRPP